MKVFAISTKRFYADGFANTIEVFSTFEKALEHLTYYYPNIQETTPEGVYSWRMYEHNEARMIFYITEFTVK